MKIKERQLKALKETRDMLIEKWDKGGKTHHWDIDSCLLCKEFFDYESNVCGNCPFCSFEEDDETEAGCQCFQILYGYKGMATVTPIDETLSIIEQMIDYWERD